MLQLQPVCLWCLLPKTETLFKHMPWNYPELQPPACLCHGCAVVCLLFALMDAWPLSLHWILLAVTSIPPALMELLTLLSFAVRGTV
ncbi:Transmembrane protein 107 [Trinorchestia longiramus]|nr:Transmembrane protein 107 [Trinorchestia longiramus]